MKLSFLGGADEVGASCTLIEIAGKRLLVDAGIRISPKSSRGLESSQLPDLQPISALGGIDYLLVTHAHTDHTGALPLVVGLYPHVPVIMTRATEALVRVLQKDAQRIMTSHFEEEGELPLFDEISVDRLMHAIQYVDFNQALRLGDGLQVTYHVSGHIAGAAMLVIESEEGTLVMSGDVSKSPQRTVESVRVPRIKADALVLESTYGGRLHANREAEERRLIDSLKRVTERGGKVLIPAFALGRAQEIIQIILAYRDQFEAPVYVDGMVRSVCDAYVGFKDILPKTMVRAAGDKHLFFRQNILPITHTAQRQQIADSPTPLIVVASSGMLTGGASQYYAKYFVGDERNAIFLTGYQDEESPGKLLQKLMKDRQEGDEPTLRLDKDVLKVRCEVGTYSLSAHADEGELVSIAKAFGAQEVMLVHGDASARHSLASALRQRQIIVSSPKVGTTRELVFKKRPWAVSARLQTGSQSDRVQLKELWDSVKDQAGNYYSARELAQIWWGDGARDKEMASVLAHPDNMYFAADWRNQSTFRINSVEQVTRTLRQRAIMLANPDLVGKLVVLRNSNNQPRLGVVRSADVDRFEAEAESSKGSHFPADALLWVIGQWAKNPQIEGGTKSQLAQLLRDARAQVDTILPFRQRQALVQDGQAVNPADLVPDNLPDGVSEQVALIAIVLALADDHATLEQDGLKPQRTLEAGPLEQNQARDFAMSIFPPEAHLRKVGMNIHRQQLTLYFDFPQSAERHYGAIIEEIIKQTGWDVQINPSVNQQALTLVVSDLLPVGATITKSPSYFMDKREVWVEISGLSDTKALEQTYLELTGFKLMTGKPSQSEPSQGVSAPTGTLMEINATYSLIKTTLEKHGLYKASLKANQIVLSFISPQVGERFLDVINALSQQTGYPMQINPNPNQQQILLVVRQLANQAGWTIRKGPGIHVDKALVTLSLVEPSKPDVLNTLMQQVAQDTGYTLVVE